MKKFLLSIFCCLMAVFSVQAQETTATLSFANTAQRTIYTTSQQVWEQNGITFTNNKSNSTTNVADYAAPARFYKNSEIIVECSLGNITQIVFACNSSSYASALETSISGSTVSGSNVTVALDGTSNSYTISSLTGGQVRMDEVTVTYTTTGEGGDTPDPVDVAEPTFTPADGETFEESLDVTITAEEGLTVYYSTDNKVSYIEDNTVNITETTIVYAYAEDAEGNKSDVVSATYTKLVPVDPNAKEVEATISFASTAQRVSQDSNKQVWQNEGVTFTNNKANSNSNVASYTNPVRLYQNSNLVVEHEAMTKVLFVCSSSSYATALKNSIGTAATVDGSNVTVTFVNPVDDFTIASLTAQVRLTSLTVTYLTTQKVVKTPVITPESYGFYAGENVEVTITAEEGTIYYTTDGNDPTTSSEVYSAPFTVSETTTVKAIAVVDGTESEVATAVYTKGIEGTVTDAFDAYVDGERLPAAVTGYIVGYVNGSAVGDEGEYCVFGAENVEKNTNILIADDPYETDYTKCLAVQLPNNEIRTALNLIDNPNNYQVKVVIKGSLEKYFNTAGLKDLVAGELVDELYHTLTVSEAGWSTLYLGFNARIPSTVEAYTVTTVNDGWVTLTQVTGVLPAETGVIVKAPAGDYKLFNEATATANVAGNLLEGTLYTDNVDEEAYVLSAPDGVVGLYKAEMNQLEGTAWQNNANKAYLPASAVPNKTAAFYGFEWNGTTGVEGVVAEGAQDGAIYDITGRRVKAITAPGIYIVNGKKVVK